jgi:hypothetical protein
MTLFTKPFSRQRIVGLGTNHVWVSGKCPTSVPEEAAGNSSLRAVAGNTEIIAVFEPGAYCRTEFGQPANSFLHPAQLR